MSKWDRRWDWILRGLICLSPMGALAYYTAGAEEQPPGESPKVAQRGHAYLAPQAQVIIPLARG
jgi:hypothetical protein